MTSLQTDAVVAPTHLRREVRATRCCVDMRHRSLRRLCELSFPVQDIPALRTVFRDPVMRAGLTGLADGVHSGAVLHDMPTPLLLDSPLEVVNLEGLDLVVFPIVTSITTTFREGRLALHGNASWSTAAVNTSVAVASVAGGGTVGSLLGHLVLPGAGGMIGGAIGGFLAGRFGRWFANRHVHAAADTYRSAKSAWEARLEANRVEATRRLEQRACLLQAEFRDQLPRPATIARVALAFRWTGWCIVDALTSLVGRSTVGRRWRARAAERLSVANRQHFARVRLERQQLRLQFALRAHVLRREAEAAMRDHASLVAGMFEELNACCLRLDNALHERGRSRRSAT